MTPMTPIISNHERKILWQKRNDLTNEHSYSTKKAHLKNYLDILEDMHIPFVLSPWHDKDVNKETGEFKKAHKHGALYFDSLKSYSQVSELVTKYLNTPAHVEVIMSPKGMYDYFTHAENPEKNSL